MRASLVATRLARAAARPLLRAPRLAVPSRALSTAVTKIEPPSASAAPLTGAAEDAELLTEAELAARVGAAAYAPGVAPESIDGVESVKAMHSWWLSRGIGHELAQRLARRVREVGGVWADPPTLELRAKRLLGAVPLIDLNRLLHKWPEILEFKDSDVRARLEALRRALPGQDIMQMVVAHPQVLSRDADDLAARLAALPTLPFVDVARLIAVDPELLEPAPEALASRAAELQRSFSPRHLLRLAKVQPARLARLLKFPQDVLQRLEHLSVQFPGARIAAPDVTMLKMNQRRFEENFLRRKHLKRYPRGRMEQRVPVGALGVPGPRHHAAHNNLFVWAAGKRKQLEAERDARDAAAAAAAARAPPPPERDERSEAAHRTRRERRRGYR